MFSFLSPLVAGVALGALVVNVVADPGASARPASSVGGRSLLRLGIVLLGLRLSLGDLAGLGRAAASASSPSSWRRRSSARSGSARRLGVPEDLGLLVATGYSICGASAIAAMDGVVDADEEETAYAITLVTLCGTLSIFVLPLLAGPLGLRGRGVRDVGRRQRPRRRSGRGHRVARRARPPSPRPRS